MKEITNAKLKRLWKGLSAIACSDSQYNPYKGSIYFRNGWFYATDSFSLIRVELPLFKLLNYEAGKLYVVEEISEDGYPVLGQNILTEQRNANGHADYLDKLFEPDGQEPVNCEADLKYLEPVLKCFKPLGLTLRFTTDSKRLFVSSRQSFMYRKQLYEVCMEGMVMYVRVRQ